MDMKKLLQDYTSACIEHGVGTEDGNYKKANKAYDIIERSYRKIKQYENGKQNLYPLLKHENSSVRLWASSHLLDIYPNEAELVLIDIKKNGEPLTSFNAEMTISEWKKGNLIF